MKRSLSAGKEKNMDKPLRFILPVLIPMVLAVFAAVRNNATVGFFETIRQDPVRQRIFQTACV